MSHYKRNNSTIDGWLWAAGFLDFGYPNRVFERHDQSWDVAEAVRR